MTTVSVARAEKDFSGTLRRVTSGHEAVILKQGRRAVAVIVPPEEYLPARDEDIPASFWQGLKESREGIGVDMQTALHEAPPPDL
jgi:antitoxin (DNA-binding transcriptional repressor) of toxin-antitoxin stability system